MTILLIALGIGLVVFGGFVLLRHADRPGGTLKWLGMEISSTGAGLPLVALGVLCIAFAVLSTPKGATQDDRERRSSNDAVATSEPEGESSREGNLGGTAAGLTGCFTEFLSSVSGDRIARVEAGMRDVPVIGPDQALDRPFGVIFTDGADAIGAARMRLYPGPDYGSDLYKIEAIVDGSCQPVEELANASRGGNPRELQNWDTARMRFGERTYDMRIGGEGEIGILFFRRVAG
jgi:hypothetical protein